MTSEIKQDHRALLDEEATEAAATALTALSISSKTDDGDAEESFEIPQRFTKSGRKRAVPFPLKVRESIVFGPITIRDLYFSTCSYAFAYINVI